MNTHVTFIIFMFVFHSESCDSDDVLVIRTCTCGWSSWRSHAHLLHNAMDVSLNFYLYVSFYDQWLVSCLYLNLITWENGFYLWPMIMLIFGLWNTLCQKQLTKSYKFVLNYRPTYAFPHPLARVPQSAGYWVGANTLRSSSWIW